MSAPEDKWVWFEDEPTAPEPLSTDTRPVWQEPAPPLPPAQPVPAIEDSIQLLQSKLGARFDAALRDSARIEAPTPRPDPPKPEATPATPAKPTVTASGKADTPASQSALASAVSLHLEGKTEQAIELLTNALEKGEQLVEMQTAIGNLRFELDRFEAAANAFADVVAREPAYPGAHFRLAVCLLRLDKVEEAASEFRLAATLSDGDWEARLGAGLCDLKRGRGQDALIWFQQGIAAKPNDATALLGRAASLELAGRAGEALDAYRDLADREPGLEGVRDRLVSIRLAKGDWTGAAADARVLLDREPNNIRALTAMAASELKQGRLDGAAGYAARLTKAAPASFEAWITLARCHQAAGRAPEALSAFREAARMRPDSADLQLSLANVQLGQNDAAGARRSLEAALKIDPKHTSAIELLAELAEKGGDLAEAERMWTRLAATVPPEKSGAATLHAGAVRLQMGDAAGAVDAFAKYLELDPESMEARVNLGIAQWRSGEAGAAVETLQDVIASHPGLAEAWYAYAYAAIDIEDYAAAKKAFEALAGLGDRSAEVAYNLGLLLQQAGELDAAQSQYLRALEERPSLREAMERLGQIEQSRGNTEEAKSWWARLRDASAKPSEPKRAEAVGKK